MLPRLGVERRRPVPVVDENSHLGTIESFFDSDSCIQTEIAMFKGLGNLGNLASMVGAFQELPEKMKELNARMEAEHVSGASSCGRVTVVVNCVGKVQSVSISETGDEQVMETTVMEVAVLEATNIAGATAKQTYADAIRQMAADMNLDLPGMDGLLTSFTGGG